MTTERAAGGAGIMRAARLHEFGGTLRAEQVPDPEPGPDEVLVELRYSGVNPLDVWVTQGNVAGGSQRLPFIPGVEGSGYVGGKPAVVHGYGIGTVRDGLYAERAVVPRDAATELPDGVDLAQAAALGVAGITAWRTTRDIAQVSAGDRVLVLGASGGVGSLIVQLAKARGATVWGQTSNQGKTKTIQELGADRALVTDAQGLVAAVAALKPTVVIDPLGNGFTAGAIEALPNFGRLVLFGTSVGRVAEVNLQSIYRKGLTLHGYGGINEPPERLAAGFKAALAELQAGRLRVPIDAILPLEQAAEAHRRILNRQVRGKLLLQP